ncbi:MAG: PHP domain-containing protein, partial [Chloroflexota bacterium]|nr:PHP domain-containing protein [Chloroflexota bacterium]
MDSSTSTAATTDASVTASSESSAPLAAAANGHAAEEVLKPTDAVDLHLHTLASDGAWTPAALVDRLVAGGFKVAAVCDHDTQRSVPEVTRRAARRGIRIIPGVE